MPEFAWLCVAAFGAGAVDAIVGGGGLVLVPTLFGSFPQAAPATLFGTNKAISVWGTGWAAALYARRVRLRWGSLLPGAMAAFGGSLCGAWTLTLVSPSALRRALPVVLCFLLAYTLSRKDLGRRHAPRHAGRDEAALAAAIGAVVGFYDGFFGPGAGSFFVFLFVKLLGYDFLHASASAKLLNVATNAAALLVFGGQGHVVWHLAAWLACANVLGSAVGTKLALRHGAGFVRILFVVVVGALIVKTGLDALRLPLAMHQPPNDSAVRRIAPWNGR